MTANNYVKLVLSRLSSNQINRACERSNVKRMTVNAWARQDRTPRIDKFAQFADAAGYDLVLIDRKSKTMVKAPSDKLTVTVRNKRVEVFKSNKLVGYVEDDTLFGIDEKGYAEEIGTINHRVEILGKLHAWQGKQHA